MKDINTRYAMGRVLPPLDKMEANILREFGRFSRRRVFFTRAFVADQGAGWAAKYGWNTQGWNPAYVALNGLDSLLKKGYIRMVASKTT
jgi:hypothetical protein